jgi:hypothetical protein
LGLGDNVSVNTLAPHGLTGTWLLDPADVTISTGVDADETYSSDDYSPTLDYTNIEVSELEGYLASNNVEVDITGGAKAELSTGNITVDSPISWSSSTKLYLNALDASIPADDGTININANITAPNGTLEVAASSAAQSIDSTATISVKTFNVAAGNFYQQPVPITYSGTIANGSVYSGDGIALYVGGSSVATSTVASDGTFSFSTTSIPVNTDFLVAFTSGPSAGAVIQPCLRQLI